MREVPVPASSQHKPVTDGTFSVVDQNTKRTLAKGWPESHGTNPQEPILSLNIELGGLQIVL